VSLPSSGSMPCAVPHIHRPLLGDALGESFVRCTHKRMLFYSTVDLWTVNLSIMKKVRERKSKLENKMRNFHGSTFLPCEAVTHSPRKTTTSMNNVRAHYRFPYKHKGRKHLRAFTVRGTMLLSNAGSSSLTTRGGFVCGEESTNSRDKFSDIWVWR